MTQNYEHSLWFEYDAFCQLNFWFLLYTLTPLLSSSSNIRLSWVQPTEKHPYSFTHHSSDKLLDQFKNRKSLETEMKIIFSSLWSAFVKEDFQGMRGLIYKADQIDPLLKATVQAIPEAYLKEGEPQMTRPYRSILNLVQELGKETGFGPVFKRFSTQEAVYGFGDLQVKKIYDRVLEDLESAAL